MIKMHEKSDKTIKTEILQKDQTKTLHLLYLKKIVFEKFVFEKFVFEKFFEKFLYLSPKIIWIIHMTTSKLHARQKNFPRNNFMHLLNPKT